MAGEFIPLYSAAATGVFSLLGGLGGGWWIARHERIKAKALVDSAKATADAEVAAAKAKADADAPAALLGALSDFSETLNNHSISLVQDLKSEIETLKKEISNLRARTESLEEDNTECRQENRQMAQKIESLEAFLRRQNIAVPKGKSRARTFTVLENGKTTVLSAEPVVKPSRRKPGQS